MIINYRLVILFYNITSFILPFYRNCKKITLFLQGYDISALRELMCLRIFVFSYAILVVYNNEIVILEL